MTINYDYSNADLSNISEDSLKFYSFNEQTFNWEELSTTLDKINKIASTQTPHFSQFALMGQVKDLTAPTTQVTISGDKGQDNWYRSNVSVELKGEDNDGGIGLQYTLYTLNDNDWLQYQEPLTFGQEGHYKITYQSYDKAENKDDRKTIEFNIDKTPPEAKIQFNPTTFKTEIIGQDNNGEISTSIENNLVTKKTTIVDKAGNSLKIVGLNNKIGNSTTVTIKSISYNNNPPVNFDINSFYTLYTQGFNKKFTSLSQSWLDTGDIYLEIFYQALTDKSTIYTKKPNQDLQKAVRPGVVLLQVTTNQGNLKYSY